MRRNRILYLLLLLSSFVFIYFYGGKVPYSLIYSIAILPLLSLLYALLIFTRFKFTQEINSACIVKGSRIKFIFSVSNEDIFLYPYITVNFFSTGMLFSDNFQTRSFSLLPFSRKSFEFELCCKYRGTYEIGIQSIEIMDLLGIFKLSYKIAESKTVMVYPRVVPLARFYTRTDYLSESNSMIDSVFEDMSTLSDVRKYAYGDGIKRVHWKLTAKMNELLVKKYQNTMVTNALVMLDLREHAVSFEQNAVIGDRVIEAAISIIHFCLFNWIPVNLVYYRDGIASMRADNPLMFSEIYRLLGGIPFSSRIGIADILNIYLNESPNKANMVIITSHLDVELYSQISRACTSGYDISLVYVLPQDTTGVNTASPKDVLSTLPEMGVNVYRIDSDDNIKQILERPYET